MNPEFREGRAVDDFMHPTGSYRHSDDRAAAVLKRFSSFDCPQIGVSPSMTNSQNGFHALMATLISSPTNGLACENTPGADSELGMVAFTSKAAFSCCGQVRVIREFSLSSA